MLLALAGVACSAQAADMAYAGLPQPVRSAVDSFLGCAASTKVDTGGDDHFAFCDAPVVWDRDQGEALKACLLRHVIASVEEEPPAKAGAKEYRVMFSCKKAQWLALELRAYRGAIYIRGIWEVLP
jgi:hypothetical protein